MSDAIPTTIEAEIGRALPVRKIGTADLIAALNDGVRDFKLMPTYLVLLALIYPIVGLIAARASLGNGVLPLIFPLISGFALVGPLAAVGLYELSRRRQAGLDTNWTHVFDVLKSKSIGTIVALGALLLVIFVSWLVVALQLSNAILGGPVGNGITSFLGTVLTTRTGWTLIVVGNAVGGMFAVITLMISAVSFPLALDRNVSFGTAVLTSIKAVTTNPVTMGLWGAIVAGALVLGALPFFVGLAVVMPILGHATWYLYKRVVV